MANIYHNKMPQINKQILREKPVKYKKDKEILQADHYNSLAWKNLRKTYISQFPLCQCCLDHNVVKPAEHVHHKHFWSSGETEEEQWKLFLDWNNLESLCSDCHTKIHIKAKRYGMTTCDSLTDIEYEEDEH